MIRRVLNLVVLACGLSLALPPGWCCPPAVAPRASTPAPKHTCCPKPKPSQAPAAPASDCPCCEQVAAKAPPVVDPAPPDFAFVAILPPIAAPPLPAGSNETVAVARGGPVRPLHVWKCCWRC